MYALLHPLWPLPKTGYQAGLTVNTIFIFLCIFFSVS